MIWKPWKPCNFCGHRTTDIKLDPATSRPSVQLILRLPLTGSRGLVQQPCAADSLNPLAG